MILGVLIAVWQAKRTGQDPELYFDFALYAIIISVIGEPAKYKNKISPSNFLCFE